MHQQNNFRLELQVPLGLMKLQNLAKDLRGQRKKIMGFERSKRRDVGAQTESTHGRSSATQTLNKSSTFNRAIQVNRGQTKCLSRSALYLELIGPNQDYALKKKLRSLSPELIADLKDQSVNKRACRQSQTLCEPLKDPKTEKPIRSPSRKQFTQLHCRSPTKKENSSTNETFKSVEKVSGVKKESVDDIAPYLVPLGMRSNDENYIAVLKCLTSMNFITQASNYLNFSLEFLSASDENLRAEERFGNLDRPSRRPVVPVLFQYVSMLVDLDGTREVTKFRPSTGVLLRRANLIVFCCKTLDLIEGLSCNSTPITLALRKCPTIEESPIYYDLIPHPIDIEKIRAKIACRSYLSFDELHQDLELLFRNVEVYASKQHEIFACIMHTRRFLEYWRRRNHDTVHDKFLDTLKAEGAICNEIEDVAALVDVMLNALCKNRSFNVAKVIDCGCGRTDDSENLKKCPACGYYQHKECEHGFPLCLKCADEDYESMEYPHEVNGEEYKQFRMYGITQFFNAVPSKRKDVCLQIRRGSYYYVTKQLDQSILKTRLTSQIIQIEFIFKDKSNLYYAYGPLFIRPFYLKVKSSQRFYANEVIFSGNKQLIRLEDLVAECVIIDIQTFLKGKLRRVSFDDTYVVECFLDADGKLTKLSKQVLNPFALPDHAQSPFHFEFYLDKLRPAKCCTSRILGIDERQLLERFRVWRFECPVPQSILKSSQKAKFFYGHPCLQRFVRSLGEGKVIQNDIRYEVNAYLLPGDGKIDLLDRTDQCLFDSGDGNSIPTKLRI
ncbi:hypothetical protein ACOME3_000024 [Neoechinorhynchus agilis]